MIGGLVSEIQSLKRIKYESDLGSNEHYLCSGEIKAGTTFFHHLIIRHYAGLSLSNALPPQSAAVILGVFFFRSH